jgi:hypothetical protein
LSSIGLAFNGCEFEEITLSLMDFQKSARDLRNRPVACGMRAREKPSQLQSRSVHVSREFIAAARAGAFGLCAHGRSLQSG